MKHISSLLLFFVTIHACSYRTETASTLRTGWNAAVRCTTDNQDPKCLLENQWPKLAPSGSSLQVGCTSGFRMSFSSYENAYAFIPQQLAIPANSLDQNIANPIGNFSQFAGSVFATTISIKLDEAISTFGSCLRPLQTLYVCETASCGPFYNKKVSEIFSKAVNQLGKCDTTTTTDMNATNTCLQYILNAFQGAPDLSQRTTFSSTACPVLTKRNTASIRRRNIEEPCSNPSSDNEEEDEEDFSRCFPSGISVGESSNCSLPKVTLQSKKAMEQYTEGQSPNQRIELSKQLVSLHHNMGSHQCNHPMRIGRYYLCENAPSECQQYYGYNMEEVLEITNSPNQCQQVPEMERCLRSINTVFRMDQLEDYFSPNECKLI